MQSSGTAVPGPKPQAHINGFSTVLGAQQALSVRNSGPSIWKMLSDYFFFIIIIIPSSLSENSCYLSMTSGTIPLMVFQVCLSAMSLSPCLIFWMVSPKSSLTENFASTILCFHVLQFAFDFWMFLPGKHPVPNQHPSDSTAFSYQLKTFPTLHLQSFLPTPSLVLSNCISLVGWWRLDFPWTLGDI